MGSTSAEVSADPALGIVVVCARPSLTPPQVERLGRLVADGVDWERLFVLGRYHGLSPQIHRHLAEFDLLGRVPESYALRLEARVTKVQGHTLMLAAALVEVQQAFQARDIPSLAYKGPALLEQAYGTLGARFVGDLDIVVARHDLIRTADVLGALGFAPVEPLPAAPSGWRAPFRKYHDAPTFRRDRVKVEIHWTVSTVSMPWGPAGIDAFWDDHVTCQIEGHPVTTLSAHDHAFCASIHGSNHLWEGLKWLSDLAALCGRHPDLDWGALTRRAESYGVRRAFLLGWYLLESTLDVSLPGALRETIGRDASIPPLADACRKWWPVDWDAVERKRLDKLVHLARMSDGRARLRRLASLVLVPSATDWEGAPAALRRIPLGTLVYRLYRGLGRYGRWLTRRSSNGTRG